MAKKRAAADFTWAARFRLAGYWIARMRWIKPAYFAPYLSRTGWVALKKASIVRRHELDARRLQLAGGLGDVRVPQRALLDLRFARQFLDQVWSAFGSLSQLTFEKTKISGMIRWPVRLYTLPLGVW